MGAEQSVALAFPHIERRFGILYVERHFLSASGSCIRASDYKPLEKQAYAYLRVGFSDFDTYAYI